MAEFSKIAWTTHTHNPWIGCTKVSPGCDNCYAEAMMDKRFGKAKWGAGNPRVRTSTANWAKPFKWDREAKAAGTRPFVFCASLADWLDNEVPEQWRADHIDLMWKTPNLIYLLLSKRIGNVMSMVDRLPPNVALGSSFVNQLEYDRDRLKLKAAADHFHPLFTFGSFEPLIGPIILDKSAPRWVIVGGESKQGSAEPRLMAPEWARSMRDQSLRLERRFFMKQMTDHAPIPPDLMVRQFPSVAGMS